jgi:hypothetical protein
VFVKRPAVGNIRWERQFEKAEVAEAVDGDHMSQELRNSQTFVWIIAPSAGEVRIFYFVLYAGEVPRP